MPLDLTSLELSIQSLKKSLNVLGLKKESPAKTPSDELETLEAGVIQNFEVAYEMSWKFMRRWLEANGDIKSLEGITRKELFRQAREHQLISDFDLWLQFHEARNNTSHSYNVAIAQQTIAIAPVFLRAAMDFLQTLKTHND